MCSGGAGARRSRSTPFLQLLAYRQTVILEDDWCCRVEPAQLRSALEALARIAADPQLLVDFFVNYDCDLQASFGLHQRKP